ncbi:MAG: hypothetical protein JSV00_02315 [bacterium]|nr:MAG: hypothetical protein JSV00_02315 [bacterium]
MAPPDWETVVENLEELSGQIPWLERFRVQYYLDCNFQVPGAGLPRYLLLCASGLAYHLTILLLSLFRVQKESPLGLNGLVFLLDTNRTYLSTLLPIIRQARHQGLDVTIVTRRGHRATLAGEEELDGLPMVHFEDLVRGGGCRKRFLALPRALAGAARDVMLWLRSGFAGAWVTVARFSSFALTSRCYSGAVSEALGGGCVLVAANDHNMWESLLFAATRSQRRSFIVQHGVLAPFAYPMIADTCLVWGERHREVLVGEMGAPQDAVRVAGAPCFDDLSAEAMMRERVPRDTICFLSQFHGAPLMGYHAYQEAVEMFCRLAEGNRGRGWRFVIRLHPRDDRESLRIFQERYREAVASTDEDLLTLMDRALLTVLVDSTALFESVLMGVPVVQLKPEGLRRFADFSGDGLSFLCRSTRDLEMLFGELMADGARYSDALEAMGRSVDLYLANAGNAARAALQILTERVHG